jgi:tetratricopeptide (TPR) repeat protein
LVREALTMARKGLGEEHPNVAALRENLVSVLKQEGKLTEAETLYQEELARLRAVLPAGDLKLASTMTRLTSLLLEEKKFTEAEPLARECLEIREKKSPDDPRTFSARSDVGACLLGQKKHAEAEPLLVSGYEGMKEREDKIPASAKVHLREALQRVLRLYEETSRPDQAAHWKEKLAEFDQKQASK